MNLVLQRGPWFINVGKGSVQIFLTTKFSDLTFEYKAPTRTKHRYRECRLFLPKYYLFKKINKLYLPAKSIRE